MAATTMTRRRWVAAMAAALAALAIDRGVMAAPYESVPGYGSKDEFKKECLGYKGATFDSGQYSTACTYPDGDVKVCDENGKNCTYHEAEDGPPQRPTVDPFDGTPLPIITSVDTGQGGDSTIAPPSSRPGRKRKKGSKRRRQ